ncbi:MAG: hypothetical protein NT099_02995 [Candidatus Saganbacteria bacterium]|nr:hypothetical protein [Candidatus Saganbacteria bacterium]
MIKRIFLLLIALIFTLSVFEGIGPGMAQAETQTGSKTTKKVSVPKEEEYMNKGDAIAFISATDFMRERIGSLLSWAVGYDINKISRARLVPVIKYISAVPKSVPADGRTILELKVSVDDPSGLKNISGVRADLASIGKFANMMLVDNGLWGDEKANDGIYTLQTNVSPNIESGGKEIPVAVANKKGWLTLAKTSLDVSRNPQIIDARAIPDRIGRGEKRMVLIQVQIYNPGKVGDLDNVVVDLAEVGGANNVSLHNNATHGDKTAGDNIFALEYAIPGYISSGDKKIPLRITNTSGGRTAGDIIIHLSD